MTNTALLMTAMQEAGYTEKTLARATGLPCFLLNQKINGKVEFKASEIKRISDALNLELDILFAIFFSE